MLLRIGCGQPLRVLGLAAAAGVLLVGCTGKLKGDKTQQTNQEVAAAAPENADPGNRPALSQKNSPPPAQQAANTATPADSTQPDAAEEGRIVSITPSGATIRRIGPEDEPAYPSDEELERRREEASDMIYALIRVRMEEAIINRKKMLEGGTASSDVEVRRLENVIMNARQYLEENGEVVEPVDPPIVQTGGSGK